MLLALVVGFLSVGVRPYVATALALTGKSAAAVAMFGAAAESRMVVWTICALLPALYFSGTAALYVTTNWAAPQSSPQYLSGWWNKGFTAVEGERGLVPTVVNGTKGGVIGVLILAPLFGVALLICAFMAFLGPGPVILLLPIIAGLVFVAGTAAWGAVIGVLIFVRRRFGWPSGATLALLVVALMNLLINRLVAHP